MRGELKWDLSYYELVEAFFQKTFGSVAVLQIIFFLVAIWDRSSGSMKGVSER